MSGDTSAIPPPPPSSESPSSLADVTIRTMESDIDAVLRGGGALPSPRVETISVAHVAPQSHSVFSTLVLVLVGLLIAGVLFAAGYYYLPILFPKNPPTSRAPASQLSLPLPGVSPVFFSHTPFFRIFADASVDVLVPQLENSQAEGYASRLIALLKPLPSTQQFVEVLPRDEVGEALAWPLFSSRADIAVFDDDLYGAHFEKDFTFFVFRERGGAVWPGYIFKLKEGDMVSVGPQIDALLKNSPRSLGSLFLFSPGNATGTFSDFQVVGQTVSMIQFTSPRAVVAYGWFFNKYLVVSTSEAGLREAVRRL